MRSRLRERQEKTVPLLTQFKAWLDNAVHTVLPKDTFGDCRELRLEALGCADEFHQGRASGGIEQLCRALHAQRGRREKSLSVRRLRAGRSRRGDLLLAGRVLQGQPRSTR